jgi:hypothetical protein
MINNHYETIKLHCITIGNSPIIVGLPWLRKHNPNIDWKEGHVTFDSARCAKECLVTSPHAIMVAEGKAIGEYYQDTAQDMAFQDTVCSASMLQEEEDEEREERDIEEAITQGYIEETLSTWELCHVGLETTQLPEWRSASDPLRILSPYPSGAALAASETPGGFNLQNNSNQSSPPTLTRDIVPGEYHEYLHVFEAKDDQGLPPHRHYDHHIPLLEGKTPPFEPIRALDEGRLRPLREYLETNLEWGWIRESTSPAGAPIYFVQKKDGSLRLCVEYWGLNTITVKDRTPLPLIGEALDRLAKAKIYTKLDVKDAYHNLRIAEGDEWKMAFRTKYGLYEYLIMPFGLTNAPASFQRWMNEILSDYLDVFCIAYLDDILIYSDDLEQHHCHIKMILRRVEEVGLTLKASKYECHTNKTEYLGYIISPTGIEMDPEKVRVMAEWKEPTNVKGVQSFLGFANFYRRFIRGFSKITAPLTRLIRKDTPWGWDDDAQVAFEQLKRAMLSEPILQHFDPTRAITIEMDASDYAIGAVCSQSDDANILHPLGYFSRKLKSAELNYDIHDKELLAIVDALDKWSTYCKSTPHTSTILSEHKNLEYWQTKRDLNLRKARWGKRLANYNFTITYQPGNLAGKPDILSRESGDSPWEGEMKH